MDALDEQLARINQKLRIVAQRPAARKALGERQHGYHMRPKLSVLEVAEFEHAHNVQLPEGYRAFLTHVGNGGAGPYYGLLPLERCAADSGQLARPSPLKPGIRGLSDADTVACLEPESLLDGAITLV